MHTELRSSDLVFILQLGHYLFAHSKAADHDQAEASKAIQEARVEAERAQAEADHLRVALEV